MQSDTPAVYGLWYTYTVLVLVALTVVISFFALSFLGIPLLWFGLAFGGAERYAQFLPSMAVIGVLCYGIFLWKERRAHGENLVLLAVPTILVTLLTYIALYVIFHSASMYFSAI
jgi:hypothetical protein